MAHKQLTVEEREEIQQGLWKKESVRSIAKRLGRSHSSIAREINKNLPPQHRVYTPRLANERAQEKRTSRGRVDRLKNETTRQYVVGHLKQRWSPEQISGRMKKDSIGSISPEAIYQFVYAQLERKSGLFLVTKVRSKTSGATRDAVIERLADLPVHTLTTDNGSENQRWEEIEDALSIDCFFAHPYRSCERGANENANGLLRDYYPKKTDFRLVPDGELSAVEYALNSRPRKRLGFMTPLEVWSGAIEG